MKNSITPQPKWKSKPAWIAFAVLLGFILKNYGLLAAIGLTPTSYQELTTLIFVAVTAFGIVNDPSDSAKL